MFRTLHFVTGDFEKHNVFLPDREYGLALDALVKGCADVLVTRGSGRALRVLSGKRSVEPQPDWWFVGGRTRPGDTPAEGASRNVKRELGLSIAPSRFGVVGNYSLVWRMRVQSPVTNGTADISTVHELRLSEPEASSITLEQLIKSEYCDMRWFAPSEILDGEFHPALQQAVRDLLAKRALEDLAVAVGLGHRQAVVDAAARLVAWHEAAVGECALKVRFRDGAYSFVDHSTGADVERPVKPLAACARADIASQPTTCSFSSSQKAALAGAGLGAALAFLLSAALARRR